MYSLLIPLRTERLLVPRACVAEVTAFAEPDPPAQAEAPGWFLGTITWNGRQVPVVSLDDAERVVPDDRKAARRRIVIFHALGNRLSTGYYGVLTQGFPQLVRVNRDVVTFDEGELPSDRPFLCRVRMIHEFPLMPDVDRLEDMLADELDTIAA